MAAVDQKPGFFHAKKISSLTGKTWEDLHLPTSIYKRHYIDLVTSIQIHCTLYFFFALLLFVCPVHSAMLHFLQFIRLASHPKLINTIVKNPPLRSVKIDLMHIHIPPPNRRGASAIHIPSSENQQAPQVSQDKKNGKNKPFSVSPLSLIAAAVLWLLWLKNPVFFHAKKQISFANREHLGSPSMRYIASEGSRGRVSAVQISALKCFD